MGSRSRKLIPLASTGMVLDKLLKRFGLEVQQRAWEIERQWDEIVGAGISAHTSVTEIRYRKLFVAVDSPAWVQQLTLLKGTFLPRINARFDKPIVRDIVFRVGPLPTKTVPTQEAPPSPRELTGEEKAAISEQLEALRDPDLREILRSVMVADTRIRK